MCTQVAEDAEDAEESEEGGVEFVEEISHSLDVVVEMFKLGLCEVAQCFCEEGLVMEFFQGTHGDFDEMSTFSLCSPAIPFGYIRGDAVTGPSHLTCQTISFFARECLCDCIDFYAELVGFLPNNESLIRTDAHGDSLEQVQEDVFIRSRGKFEVDRSFCIKKTKDRFSARREPVFFCIVCIS